MDTVIVYSASDTQSQVEKLLHDDTVASFTEQRELPTARWAHPDQLMSRLLKMEGAPASFGSNPHPYVLLRNSFFDYTPELQQYALCHELRHGYVKLAGQLPDFFRERHQLFSDFIQPATTLGLAKILWKFVSMPLEVAVDTWLNKNLTGAANKHLADKCAKLETDYNPRPIPQTNSTGLILDMTPRVYYVAQMCRLGFNTRNAYELGCTFLTHRAPLIFEHEREPKVLALHPVTTHDYLDFARVLLPKILR